MPRISRREFLRQAGQAGLAVGIGAQLGGLLGCSSSGQSVIQSTGSYDAIIVGGGTRVQSWPPSCRPASGGRKRILIIEAGGPTSAAIGGTDFPPWLPRRPHRSHHLRCAGRVLADGVHAAGRAVPAYRDGIYLSGHRIGRQFSMFNGMLFQTNPPAGLRPQLAGGMALGRHGSLTSIACGRRFRSPIRRRPTAFRRITGPAQIIHPLYAGDGWIEGDTSQPFDRARVSTAVRTSRPPMAIARDRSADISRQSIRAATRFGLEILLLQQGHRRSTLTATAKRLRCTTTERSGSRPVADRARRAPSRLNALAVC